MFALLAHPLPVSLPLEDPILKFMLIMAIVLAAPLLLNKLRIPYLLGSSSRARSSGPTASTWCCATAASSLRHGPGCSHIMFLSWV